MAYAALACQLIVMVVFATALAGKRSGKAFADFTVSVGRLLPPRFTGWRRPVAWAVLLAEATIVVGTAVPASSLLGFGMAAVLLIAFTVAITFALRRGQRAPCHCFGASNRRLSWVHVVRNLLLLVVAGSGMALSAAASWPTMELGGVAVAGVAAVTAAVVVIHLEDFVSLFAPTRTVD